jgi:hemolysin III
VSDSIYTREEERLNYATHALAAILAVIGCIHLIDRSIKQDDLYLLIAMMAFGGSLVLAFLASAVYHWVEKPTYKQHFRLLDHYAIYLVIVGTYTPFTLTAMPRPIGITVLVVVWLLSLLAMIFKYFVRRDLQKYHKLDVVVYIIIGVTALIWLEPMVTHLSLSCVLWIALGGFFYIIGSIFYLWKSLPYNHVIWHVFAAIGAIIHYFTVVTYVLPGY